MDEREYQEQLQAAAELIIKAAQGIDAYKTVTDKVIELVSRRPDAVIPEAEYQKIRETVSAEITKTIANTPVPAPDMSQAAYKIRSITTQSHGKKSSSYFGASPPKNAKNLIKIARARPAAASLFGALPPRRGQKGQKGAQRPSVSEHMRPFF